MKTLQFEDRESWLAARIGKITGSRLKDITAKRDGSQKIGYYELIAERLAIPSDGENPMDRGTRLEDEAIERFMAETGKKVNTSLVIWTREDDENIAVSPDGFVGVKEAVEVKCLASARHVEALLTEQIPSEYELQVLQYFIVNDKLKTLYFIFYDPRMSVKAMFYRTVHRADIQEKIDEYLELERNVLKMVVNDVVKLSF